MESVEMRCRSCGSELGSRKLPDGQCPRCLLGLALARQSEESPLRGQQIGNYRIVRRLGRGGMGEILLAEDLVLERRVALKLLPPDLAESPDRLERFGREIRTVAALNHPNIVTVHSVEEVDGLHFYSMELIEGRTLTSVLESGALSLGQLLEIAIPLTDALRTAHEQGIVHRDLKPDNVMITDDGLVKVLDFGLAKAAAKLPAEGDLNGPTEHLTAEGTMIGTLPYMSPEQLRGDDLDQRSDIFSLGVVLYEMACGRRPFGGRRAVDLLSSILKDSPRPITEIDPQQPRQLWGIIRHCLEKDAGARFQTSRDVLNELRDLRREEVSEARLPGRGASGARRRWLEVPRWAAWAVAATLVMAALVVWWSPDRIEPPKPAAAESIDSLAVLPLRDLSDDPREDYFSDGMTEELITNVARREGLRVIAPTSILPLKGTDRPLAATAARLGVDAIVEGTVQRTDERVRISAHLVRAASGDVLWAESYDQALEGVLELQSRVARAIAAEIQREIIGGSTSTRDRQIDPAAHEAYLKGRFFWNQRHPEALRKAIEYLNRAVEIDPTFAPAHAAIADCYNLLGSVLYPVMDPREAMPRAHEASQRALDLDPDLAEAHASLGHYLHVYEWDRQAASEEFNQALELNPNYATAHHWYSILLTFEGEHDRAIEHARTAVELDPLSIIITLNLGVRYFYARDPDRALEQFNMALDLNPDFFLTHLFLGRLHQMDGDQKAAIREFRVSRRQSNNGTLATAFLANAYAHSGDSKRAMELLADLQLIAESTFVPAHIFAIVYEGLGDTDMMFSSLAEAAAEKSGMMTYLEVDPLCDAYQDDPRLVELISQVR